MSEPMIKHALVVKTVSLKSTNRVVYGNFHLIFIFVGNKNGKN